MGGTIRPVVVIGFVTAIALAGCAVGPVDDSPDPASFDYPDGFAETGIANATAAIESHADSLDSPYRVNYSLIQHGERGRAVIEGTIECRPGDEKSAILLERTVGPNLERVKVFQSGVDRYVYRADGVDFSVDHQHLPFQAPIYDDRATLIEMLDALELEAERVQDTEGTPVVVYDVRNISSDRFSTKIPEGDGTLRVSANGTIHSIDVDFTQVVSGVESGVSFRYTKYHDVNVTLERPSWIDRADE